MVHTTTAVFLQLLITAACPPSSATSLPTTAAPPLSDEARDQPIEQTASAIVSGQPLPGNNEQLRAELRAKIAVLAAKHDHETTELTESKP